MNQSAPPPGQAAGQEPELPAWLEPVRRAAASISAADLTTWQPPPGREPRRGAVLMLFGDPTPRSATAGLPGSPGSARTAERPETTGDLLFTERAHHLRSHPGQVSFPGGAADPGETPEETALREADEETGVVRDTVRVFGKLPALWLSPSNFSVTTVLGYSSEQHALRANPDEVRAIWRTPIGHLIEPTNRIRARHPSGFVGPAFWIGPDRDVLLWGFTAGIVDRLLGYLGWGEPWDESRIVDLPPPMLRP
ncbi:MAG: NUDIX hydrolase [Nocardioides sp.]